MLYSAIHVGSHWKIHDRREIKNTDNTQTKHHPEKANNANHSKSKGSVAYNDTRPHGVTVTKSSVALKDGD